ncbi:MAG: DJ-1/PfpI family protein [Methanotrichaceae archaeon]
MMPDTSLDKIKPEEFDAVVLPGGSPGFINLKNDERVLRILQDMNEAGKYVCAICAAPSVLIKAEVLEGRKATVSPVGREEMKASTEYVDERVVGRQKARHKPVTWRVPRTFRTNTARSLSLIFPAESTFTSSTQALM